MVIATERLLLEPFDLQHLAGLHVIESDPRVMRYVGPIRGIDETRATITRAQDHWRRYGHGW